MTYKYYIYRTSGAIVFYQVRDDNSYIWTCWIGKIKRTLETYGPNDFTNWEPYKVSEDEYITQLGLMEL